MVVPLPNLSVPAIDPNRRSEIIEKAKQIFIKHGYRKTTTEDIGKACGLGKAALYHYFVSKEAIFAEAVRTESERLLTLMQQAVAANPDPRAKLAAMIKTRFKFIREFLIGNVLADIDMILPLAAKARQSYFQREVKMVEEILLEGQRLGVFKPMNLKEVPIILISGLRGIETHFAEVQGAPAIETGLDVLLDVFFEGVCQ